MVWTGPVGRSVRKALVRRASSALVVALAVLVLTVTSTVRASESDAGDAHDSFQVHGFVSQGFILTLHNDYIVDDSTDGSFEFSEVGINFTQPLTSTLRTGVQIFANIFGPSGDYKAAFDWFYLDYRWQDWMGFRAGRLKIPYGLYNEIQDIDSARVPVLLPQSVYPSQGREMLFAQTGFEVYGFARSEPIGTVEYNLWGGTIFMDAESLVPPGSPIDLDIRVPFAAGGRLLWETPLDGLRMAGSAQIVHLDTTAFVPQIQPILIENRSLLWVGSVEYAEGAAALTAEYSRWYADQHSNNAVISPAIENVSERAYVMAGYRLTPRLQPSVYYSLFFPDIENREGKENVQHDAAATLRFDINPHWLVKAEGHYMVGTAGLLNPLRVNAPDLSEARKHWAAFFLKTTGHF